MVVEQLVSCFMLPVLTDAGEIKGKAKGRDLGPLLILSTNFLAGLSSV